MNIGFLTPLLPAVKPRISGTHRVIISPERADFGREKNLARRRRQQKNARERNPEKFREKKRREYLANPVATLMRYVQWVEKNAEHRRAYNREWMRRRRAAKRQSQG
jgi:hypothetical protein